MLATKLLVAVAVPALFIGVAFTQVQDRGDASTLARVDVVRAAVPGAWIPYSAELVIVEHDNVQRGPVYRSADGSKATYLDTPGGRAITIYNARTTRKYVKVGNRSWASFAADPKIFIPPQREFAARADRATLLPTPVAGFDVYELKTRSGNISRIVPGLNDLFLLWKSADGRSSEYQNIRIGEPPPDVFSPPVGAVVRNEPSREKN